MGQQQLILLVLATVIVGIAIVVGIRAFSENSIKANADAMMQDMVRIANDAQAWKQKPSPFGGQQDDTPTEATIKATPADFSGAGFVELGYAEVAENIYENLNGRFAIVPSTASTVITGVNLVKGTCVSITLNGITDANIQPNGAPVLGGYTEPLTATTSGCS